MNGRTKRPKRYLGDHYRFDLAFQPFRDMRGKITLAGYTIVPYEEYWNVIEDELYFETHDDALDYVRDVYYAIASAVSIIEEDKRRYHAKT